MSTNKQCFKAVVIGTSAGGFHALNSILNPLPNDFPLPIIIVRHQLASADDYLIKALNNICQLQVCYAREGEKPIAGKVYIATPDRHLLINNKGLFTLSHGERINFSRPSIDVLFNSAAQYYSKYLLGVILTGANHDGAEGLKTIKQQGGTILVQDPDSAEAREMPEAALKSVAADYIVWLDQIGPLLWSLTR